MMLESELCVTFLQQLDKEWKPYPECCGYDIVLVHDTGVQVGVEAKLRGNVKVLDQILPGYGAKRVPHYLAILLPSVCYAGQGGKCLYSLLKKIKVHPLCEHSAFPSFDSIYMKRMLWNNPDRLELPSHAACVIPGKPSPKSLSVWKINAIRLDFLFIQTGKVTAQQFKQHGQDTRLWVDRGWARRLSRGVYTGTGEGPMVKFKEEATTLIDELYRSGSTVKTEEVYQ